MNLVIAIIVAMLVLCTITVVLLVELSLLVVAPAWQGVRRLLDWPSPTPRAETVATRRHRHSYIDVEFKEIVRRP